MPALLSQIQASGQILWGLPCAGVLFHLLLQKRGTCRGPRRLFDPNIFFSCFSIFLPPS